MGKVTFLTDELYDYLLKTSVRENPLLIELNHQTNVKFGVPMQCSLEQLNFLAWLVQLLRPNRILELGTYTGMSSLAMAQHLPDGGKIICLDHDQRFTRVAVEYWQKAEVADKIDLRIGKAVDLLADLLAEGDDQFDLMFIDADKGNNEYYYEAGLRLVKPGGVIMIDNVLWEGAVTDLNDERPNTVLIRQFNEKLAADPRVAITLLPIGDGISLALKK